MRMLLAKVLVLAGFVPPYWVGLWIAAHRTEQWEMGSLVAGFAFVFSFFAVAIFAAIAGIVAPQVSSGRLFGACAAGVAILVGAMNLVSRFAPELMGALGVVALVLAVEKIISGASAADQLTTEAPSQTPG
jgi:hypothetical protein